MPGAAGRGAVGELEDWSIKITEMRKPAAGIIVHVGQVERGTPKVGDKVELSVPEGTIVTISMFVYLFPIIALMIGAFMGAAFGGIFKINQSISAALTGGIAMAIVFTALKRFEKTEKFKEKYQTRMTRVIASAGSPP